MVQRYQETFLYSHSFATTTAAHFNRYPNPYSSHVLSCDTLDSHLDDSGNLHTTRLVVKRGRLPMFIAPFISGDHLESWIIEKIWVDPHSRKLLLYTANIDHHRFVKVEERLTFTDVGDATRVESLVNFSSRLFGVKRRIEEWSRTKFANNIQKTRDGLQYVMNRMTAQSNLLGSLFMED